MYRVFLASPGMAEGAPAGSTRFPIPVFGPHCVCCDADAAGRETRYDASTDQLDVDGIGVPVCAACAGHALLPQPQMTSLGSLLLVGLAVAALGVILRIRSPGHAAFPWLAAIGPALAAYAGVRLFWPRRSPEGHHRDLMIHVVPGSAVIFTRNPQLASRLLSLNPGAWSG